MRLIPNPFLILSLSTWVALMVTTGVHAQPTVTPEAREEARRRFAVAERLFAQKDYAAAAAELEAAYRIAPIPRALLTLARAFVALGDPIRARDALERFFREAGKEASNEERREAERLLADQRAQIGKVLVETNVPGATVLVNGTERGTTSTTAPYVFPVEVRSGQVSVAARATGYDETVTRVEVAGGTEVRTTLELRPLVGGTVRIASKLPGVKVYFDKEPVGITPLERTLAARPGFHSVTGTRVGYLEARNNIEVRAGGEVSVRLDMQRDPEAPGSVMGTLRLKIPNAPATLRVDGEPVEDPNGDVLLPVGPHEAYLEVGERSPARGSVNITAGQVTQWAPELRWNASARAERASSAKTQRIWGWATLASGLGIFSVALALRFVSDNRLDSEKNKARKALIDLCKRDPLTCETMDLSRAAEEAERAYNDDVDYVNSMKIATGVSMGIGAAAAVTGAVLLITAPSEKKIDSKASASRRKRLDFQLGLGAANLKYTF